MVKREYVVQWGNGVWKSWWTEKEFRWRWRAKRYALKMLARNSNLAPWRVIELDYSTKKRTIIFEGHINLNWRDIKPGHFENFTEEDVERYYKPLIHIDGRTGKRTEIK